MTLLIDTFNQMKQTANILELKTTSKTFIKIIWISTPPLPPPASPRQSFLKRVMVEKNLGGWRNNRNQKLKNAFQKSSIKSINAQGRAAAAPFAFRDFQKMQAQKLRIELFLESKGKAFLLFSQNIINFFSMNILKTMKCQKQRVNQSSKIEAQKYIFLISIIPICHANTRS